MKRHLLIPLVLLLALTRCQRPAPPTTAEQPRANAPTRPGRVIFYRSPMNPAQTSPTPRKDEMGMDYLPVYEHDVSGAGAGPPGFAAITLDAQQQRLIGLRTAVVRRAAFAAALRTTGRVTYDETRVHHIHTRYDAYVERLYADFTGKYVRRGDPLVSLYSPDLYAAEQEYLLAVRAHLGGLSEAARQKLLLWNVSPGDIAALEKNDRPSYTLDLYAPISGYVIGKMAVHGMRVRPEDSLFDIVDLSRVWVLADIYEYELPRVALGQQATMTLSYWPDRTWQGKVSYIYPSVDEKTRTVKVRLDVDNPRGELKGEMFAGVVLAVAPRQALLVPEDAVIETGARQIAFVVDEDAGGARLHPREIHTGDRADGLIEVRDGLRAGERVASGASFLLDSESRLQAALSSLASPASRDGGQP